MKKIGIIGGLGPESTVDYYKEIISAFNTQYKELSYPEMVIYSANINKLLEFVNSKKWSEFADWLGEKVISVYRAGADFAAIASNTPHIVFEEVKKKSPITLLSIVEETCKEAGRLQAKRIGLLGTRLTMESDFYKEHLKDNGISVVVPTKPERELIQERLFSEIELGIFKDSTRDELLGIVKRMIDEDKIDSLILGCTELPLILTESKYGVPFLNTTAIHCESIVRYCVEE
ncbi:MAG: amino acid racemase [candidate division WOR-3 bacterium]